MATIRAYIGLGANVGDARRTLAAAVRGLGRLPGATVAGVSRLYVTRPVEVTDQPEFHNAVVALDFPFDGDLEAGALGLLVELKSMERAFGRQDRFRYGPRELDLDLLLFGDAQLTVERPAEGQSIDPAKAGKLLVIPHPEARSRLFVLAPLSDLAPALRPPGWNESVAEARLRQETQEDPDAVRVVGEWEAAAGRWRP